jgi:nitrous oxide reductase accessory protein NosL
MKPQASNLHPAIYSADTKVNKNTRPRRIPAMSNAARTCTLLSVALFLAAMSVLLVLTPSRAADPGKGPVPGRETLDQNGRMQIGDQDSCPVCGMRVAEYARFASAIQFSDKTTYYFCSCGCMLRAWLHPDIFLAASRDDLRLPVVRDYFTGDQLDGRTVFWVAGSDVIGPMGPAMVPVKGEQALDAFKRRHGSKVVFLLEELDPDKWLAITGRKAAK